MVEREMNSLEIFLTLLAIVIVSPEHTGECRGHFSL
jgi:hypothetical protein